MKRRLICRYGVPILKNSYWKGNNASFEQEGLIERFAQGIFPGWSLGAIKNARYSAVLEKCEKAEPSVTVCESVSFIMIEVWKRWWREGCVVRAGRGGNSNVIHG